MIPGHFDSGSNEVQHVKAKLCERKSKYGEQSVCFYFSETPPIFRKEIKKKSHKIMRAGRWEGKFRLEAGKHMVNGLWMNSNWQYPIPLALGR